MTPFADIGVNIAFHDVIELAKQIIAFTKLPEAADSDGLHHALREDYGRARTQAQALTEGSKTAMLLTPGAPRTTIETWDTCKKVPLIGRTRS
jgi:hypothetical protein